MLVRRVTRQSLFLRPAGWRWPKSRGTSHACPDSPCVLGRSKQGHTERVPPLPAALLGTAMLEKFDLAVAHGHTLCQSDCE